MLKGVNRQVIEISDTGSRYFERAILIVRPEFLGEQPRRLQNDANRVVASFGRPPSLNAAGGSDETSLPQKRPFKPWFSRALRIGLGLLISFAVCVVLIKLL